MNFLFCDFQHSVGDLPNLVIRLIISLRATEHIGYLHAIE